MADSDEQARTMFYAWNALESWFEAKGMEDIYVSVDTFVYYVEGDSDARVAPDVFVVFGVENRVRKTYRVFDEKGKVPDFVLEVASASSYETDRKKNFKLYERLGVREYFRYDPTGTTMAREPGGWRLRGDRLHGTAYRRLPLRRDGSIASEVLGLDLRVRKAERERGYRELRLRDPATGRDLNTHAQERAARRNAERRVRELEDQVAALRAALSTRE